MDKALIVEKMRNLFTIEHVKRELFPFYMAFIIMFGFAFNMYALYTGAVVLSFAFRPTCLQACLKINNVQIFIFICGIVWLSSCLYSLNPIFALKYMFLYYSAYCITVFNSPAVYRRMLKYLVLLGGIHVAFILIQFFDNEYVIEVGERFLSSEQLQINNQLYTYSHACAGLTGQTGQAALFILLFLFALTPYAMKNWKVLFLFPPAIIALMLTQKRSFLFIGIFLVLGFLLHGSKRLNLHKKIFLITLLGVLSIIVAYYVETKFDISFLIDKIESGSTSNRDVLWMKMFKIFENNPIIGCGLCSTDVILGMTGHNIYIQLLCENGIIGSIFFYALLSYSLRLVLKTRDNAEEAIFSKISILFILTYGFLGNPIYEIQTLFILFVGMTILKKKKVKPCVY